MPLITTSDAPYQVAYASQRVSALFHCCFTFPKLSASHDDLYKKLRLRYARHHMPARKNGQCDVMCTFDLYVTMPSLLRLKKHVSKMRTRLQTSQGGCRRGVPIHFAQQGGEIPQVTGKQQ